MNNALDQRNNTNWPLQVNAVTPQTVTATMAGANGLADVTTGVVGNGVVTDANGVSYNVKLPAPSRAGTLVVDFRRQ